MRSMYNVVLAQMGQHMLCRVRFLSFDRQRFTRRLLATTALIGLTNTTISLQARAGQLDISAFTSYSSSNFNSIVPGPFALYSVNVGSIMPTQLNEGFAEVGKKTAGFDLLTSQAALTANLLTSIEPVVIGPGGKLYLTDGHHTFTALDNSTFGASNPIVYVNVIANFSNLTTAQFFTMLQQDNFVLPINDGVPQPFNVNTGAPIPTTLTGLTSDPYRGLEYSILKNKNSKLFPTAANITGAVGSATPGLDKVTGFYSDFIEADAYRGATTKSGGTGLSYLSPGDIALATQWNLNANSVTSLPNVSGTVKAGQLPGFILGGNITVSGTISNATLANGTLDGTQTGTFDEASTFASFNGVTSINVGSVTIGTPLNGFIMQLGDDLKHTVTLTGSNTYTGGTTIIAGTLAIGSDAALGAASTGFTYDPNNIAASVHAANGIIFNSLTEGAGTLQIGTTAGGGTSTFSTNRPIAIDGELATINVNGYVVSPTGQLVSLGSGGVGIGNATGVSDLTIDDLNAGTQGKLILSTNSPDFYGNIIVGSSGTPTVEVMSDGALGNTTGVPASIGQVELNGGTFQVGANITAPERDFFLGGGSLFDVNGFTSSWGSLTDVQRTLEILNSNTTTAGAATFTSLAAAGGTATLQLAGGAAGETVTLTNGISQSNAGTLVIQPTSSTSLSTTEKVFSGTGTASLENGIAPAWIVTNNGAAKSVGPYDFVTYGANGYVKATYSATTLGAAPTSVVALAANSTPTGNVSAFALNTEGKTIALGANTLTIGDGTSASAAGLILANGSAITGGTLAFNGSQGVIWMGGTATSSAATISSQITGSNGLTFAGVGNVTLSSAANVSGLITIDSGAVTLGATNVFAGDSAGILLADTKSKPAAATLNVTASNTLAALNGVGNNSAVNITGAATQLTIGDGNNLSSTILSTITDTAVVSGGTSIIKAGSGLLDVSGGALTLTAGSNISVIGGQLRVAASIFKNTNNISVGSGTEVQFAQNGGGMFAGNVTGLGALHLIGGTLQLTGAGNTYGGGTIVETGSTLDLTTANVSSGNANITNAGGIIVFDQATTGTYSGVISDGRQMEATTGATLSGTFIKDDSTGGNGGNVTLSQQQTFTGMTYVEAGTLTLGAANSLINSAGIDLGRVGGGATATLAMNADQTFASLSSEATNTTSLALNGHTLTLGTTSGINPNASAIFGGAITDGSTAGGSLVKAGTGTAILTGTNTYTGSTTINAGTLEVDGSLASSNVIVNGGGTLAGTGTIGDPIVNAGGMLAPGTASSIGTLTINGPLTFMPGSFYNVRITPTSNDFTQVNGATTINGGTVNTSISSGTYQPLARYTILTSTLGVNGTFSGVSAGGLAFLSPTLSYDANDVYLNVTPNYNFAAAAFTRNELAVANALSAAGPRNANAPLVLAFDKLTIPEAQAALDSISGEGIAAADTLALRANELFSDAMNDQATLWRNGSSAANSIILTDRPFGALGYAPSSKMKSPIVVRDPLLPPVRTWSAWASGFGAGETVHGSLAGLGTATQSATLYGGAVGIDYQINPNLLFGVSGGGSEGYFSVPGRTTSGTVTGGHIGTYGVASFGSFYVASSSSLSFYHSSETRLLAGFGGLGGETDHGSYASRAARARLEAGRRFADVFGATITPFLALEIADLRSNGFNEAPTTGAGNFALNVQGRDTASVPAYLGLRFEKRFDVGQGMTLKPILSVAYGHDFAPERTITNALINLPGASFEVDGAQVARDFVQAKAGFEWSLSPTALAFANFDGAFSGKDQLYAGKGGVKFVW